MLCFMFMTYHFCWCFKYFSTYQAYILVLEYFILYRWNFRMYPFVHIQQIFIGKAHPTVCSVLLVCSVIKNSLLMQYFEVNLLFNKNKLFFTLIWGNFSGSILSGIYDRLCAAQNIVTRGYFLQNCSHTASKQLIFLHMCYH